MIQRAKNMLNGTKYNIDMVLNEHQEKRDLKKAIGIEKDQLADITIREGNLRTEYQQQLNRFAGRLFLVGEIRTDTHDKEYRKAVRIAESYRFDMDDSEYRQAHDAANEIHDFITMERMSHAIESASAIIDNTEDGITNYLVNTAANKKQFIANQDAFNNTNIALRNALTDEYSSAYWGPPITKHLDYNDSVTHETMSAIDFGVFGVPNEKVAAVTVVSSIEPKKPYDPTSYSRDMQRELQNGGVVMLQKDRFVGRPTNWVSIYTGSES